VGLLGFFCGCALAFSFLFLVRRSAYILPVYVGVPYAFNKTDYYLSKKKKFFCEFGPLEIHENLTKAIPLSLKGA
jgi:hypothetical protein